MLIYAFVFFLMPEPEEEFLLQQESFSGILDAFDHAGYTILDFLLALLMQKYFKKSAYTLEFLRRSGDVLKALLEHAGIPKEAKIAASKALHPIYAHKIQCLVKPSSGWNFSAYTVMPDDVDDFDINNLTQDTAKNAPLVSALLDALLSAKKRPWASQVSQTDGDGDVIMDAVGGLDGDSSADEDEASLTGSTGLVPQTRMDGGKQNEVLLAIVRLMLDWVAVQPNLAIASRSRL